MDKYKALRDQIVKKIVVDTAIPKDVINLVIDYQSRKMVEALVSPGIFTVELSGFGVFKFSPTLVKRHFKLLLLMLKNGRKELDEKELTVKRCNFLVNMVRNAGEDVGLLIKKAGDELGADLRRMAEQTDSPEEA